MLSACRIDSPVVNCQPKVSIGMPVYNGEKFIRSALDSLLAQTFTDFELIISDNASTDLTESICREYANKDRRIQYIRQAMNIGPVANFQFVLDAAVGDYFMWAAADDQWDLLWIERLLPIAAENQCIATGIFMPIDAAGTEIRHPANGRKLEFSGSRMYRRMKFYLEPGVLGKGNPIYGIMPAAILKKIGVAWFASEAIGGALYLYVILDQMEIRCDQGVWLFKRFHHESWGEVLSQDATDKIDKGYFKKIARLIKSMILEPVPQQYVGKSHSYEKPWLWLTYVIALIWLIYIAVIWKIQRCIQGAVSA
jgi:glycosyltransferase involved in cell wall biosynthesis